MDEKIIKIILQENNTLKDALERINEVGIRIVLVIDKNRKLLGIATEGDIRRALLMGNKFNCPISKIMVVNPIVVLNKTPIDKIVQIMFEKGIQEIPVLDKKGVLIDLALFPKLKNIPLSSPDITIKEVEVINQVLLTPNLSIGPKVQEFEEKIARYIGTKYAVAVNSGTSGLHLCVRSLDIKDGDEVITTPFSFIASANCILFERAKPVFVDIDEDTLCIDASKIEEKITEKTKAILPVHVFGRACEMDKIVDIANKYNLAIIEDACEAIGTEYKGRKVGSFGDCGVFGFYPNKQITTGEGGIIVTNNEKIAELCRSMRNQGRDETSAKMSFSRLGYNYRMSELSAALGVVQAERISQILEKRQKVVDSYNQKLAGIEGIKIPKIDKNVLMSWFVYVIRLDGDKFSSEDRNAIIEELKKRGIICGSYFPPIHLESFYAEKFGYKSGDFPVTEKASVSTIALPFFNNISKQDIVYVCKNIKDILSKFNK